MGHKFYIQLALPISPEIMDGFWCSRCLGAITPLVVKIWTKQPWVKIENFLFALPLSPEIIDGFWGSRCLNDRINLPDMIGTFASRTNVSLVAKNWTKKLSQLFEDGFWCSRCLNDRIEVPDMMKLFAGGATTPWWWKFELNNPGWKLKICAMLIAISRYLEAKCDNGYFMIFFVL